MQVYKFPSKSEWPDLLKRPAMDAGSLAENVKRILIDVRNGGDRAVKGFTKDFDRAEVYELQVTENEIDEAVTNIPAELKLAIETAASNIRLFHAAQMRQEEVIETMPGILCWRKSVGIEKVGLYIPGGTAPLFSTILMLGIPASIAGCREVILCTPPSPTGAIHPAILFTARLVGINKIFRVGGAQAIGAMAYGTETIPKVYKIFGPGNQYVTAAKMLVQQEGVAIDMPAGPSEVAVFADASAVPAFVAADLLSQAEHGADSQVLLVATPDADIDGIQKELAVQLDRLPRKAIAAKALEQSRIVIVKDQEEGLEILNEYAPEHLIVCCENSDSFAEKVVNAGSVFIGNYAPESAGDYASGTNHTLPTNGYAKAYSGVSVDSFVKKISFQKLTAAGLANIAPSVIEMAEAENLSAHANAVAIRVKK
ncbi:MAG: histidinol dehydrogenase [Gemmatimonadaceae bacterium]|nr:histidinol dehydrogenase [Chitinophagaceae bacterium]